MFWINWPIIIQNIFQILKASTYHESETIEVLEGCVILNKKKLFASSLSKRRVSSILRTAEGSELKLPGHDKVDVEKSSEGCQPPLMYVSCSSSRSIWSKHWKRQSCSNRQKLKQIWLYGWNNAWQLRRGVLNNFLLIFSYSFSKNVPSNFQKVFLFKIIKS